jgi:hypothetical protein
MRIFFGHFAGGGLFRSAQWRVRAKHCQCRGRRLRWICGVEIPVSGRYCRRHRLNGPATLHKAVICSSGEAAHWQLMRVRRTYHADGFGLRRRGADRGRARKDGAGLGSWMNVLIPSDCLRCLLSFALSRSVHSTGEAAASCALGPSDILSPTGARF